MNTASPYHSYHQATLLAKEGLIDQALDQIEQALQKQQRPEYLLVKGKLLAQAKRYEEAVQTLRQIPENTVEWAQAERAIRKAEKLKQGGLFRSLPNTGVWLLPVLWLLFFVGAVLFATLYFTGKKQLHLQQSIGALTENYNQLDRQLSRLNASLATKELAGKDELEQAKQELLAGFNEQFAKEAKLVQNQNTRLGDVEKSTEEIKEAVAVQSNQIERLKKELLASLNEHGVDKASLSEIKTKLEQLAKIIMQKGGSNN